jgi:hypothetical protein
MDRLCHPSGRLSFSLEENQAPLAYPTQSPSASRSWMTNSCAIDSHTTMSPTTEHRIKCRVLAPKLGSKFIPVNNIVCLLDRGGLLNGTDLPDEDEDGSQMS